MSSLTWTRPRRPLVLALAIASAAVCIKTSHGQALFQEYDEMAKTLEQIWPEYKHEMSQQTGDFKDSTIVKIRTLMDSLISNKAIQCRKKGPRQAIDLVPRRRQDNSASLLVMDNSQKWNDLEHWVESLNEKVDYHNDERRLRKFNFKTCSEDNDRNFQSWGVVCQFDTHWLGSYCTEAESWGYSRNTPCIIAQMNNLVNWTPNMYKTIEELPIDMPEDLKTHIKERTNDNGGRVPQMLWLNCKGQTPEDDEYIGEVEYTPWRGFPSYYFPLIDHESYVGPMVAVRFVAPAKNVLINIECRVYSKNISHSRSDNEDSDSVFGVMNFELFIDDNWYDG